MAGNLAKPTHFAFFFLCFSQLRLYRKFYAVGLGGGLHRVGDLKVAENAWQSITRKRIGPFLSCDRSGCEEEGIQIFWK